MRKLLLLLIVLICYNNGVCQELKWEEPFRIGTRATSIAEDSKGHLYFAGEINNAAEKQTYFYNDSLPRHPEYYNYSFLVKTNKEYQIKWKKVIECYGFFNTKIEVDQNDNVVLFGTHSRSLKIDSVEINVPNHETKFFIGKFDPSGKLLWHSSVETTSHFQFPVNVKIDSDGDIYIGGDGYGLLTFYNENVADTVVGPSSDKHIFFAKYSADGKFEWAKSTANGGDSQISLYDMEIDKMKNIYLAGGWFGGSYFDSVPKVQGKSMIFIARYNANLNLEWLKQIGDRSTMINEYAGGLALDENLNSFYVTGSFIGSADFGGKTLQADDKNIFLARYSLEGDLNWVKNMGSWSGSASYKEGARKLLVDPNGFVYLSGSVGQGGDFDGVQISAYDDESNSNLYSDPFFAKFTATGELLWVTHAGHPNVVDYLNDFLKDNDDNLFFVGETKGGARFGEHELYSDHLYNVGFSARITDTAENILVLSNYDLTYEADTNLVRTFEIISSKEWSLSYDAPWISSSSMSGTGNDKILFAVDTNSSSIERNAIVKIISAGGNEEEVKITQMQSEDEVITNVDESNVSNYLTIYPNPVNNILRISTDHDLFGGIVQVSNLSGRKLIFKEDTVNEINVNGLNPGIYILKIQTPKLQLVKRFIKL